MSTTTYNVNGTISALGAAGLFTVLPAPLDIFETALRELAFVVLQRALASALTNLAAAIADAMPKHIQELLSEDTGG